MSTGHNAKATVDGQPLGIKSIDWNRTICTSSDNPMPPITMKNLLELHKEFEALRQAAFVTPPRTILRPSRKVLRMPTNPDALSFLKAIEEKPAEDFPKLVYADWLEEIGAPECHAWRWLTFKKRLPSRRRTGDMLYWAPDDEHDYHVDATAIIPAEIHNRLPTQIAINLGYQGGQLKAVAMALIAAAQAYVLAVKDGFNFDDWEAKERVEDGDAEEDTGVIFDRRSVIRDPRAIIHGDFD